MLRVRLGIRNWDRVRLLFFVDDGLDLLQDPDDDTNEVKEEDSHNKKKRIKNWYFRLENLC
jgi:hypothetical protein